MADAVQRRGLNWGCGPEPVQGWTNVDRVISKSTVIGNDITQSDLPFVTGLFDGVVANHSLQCLPGGDLDHAIQEFHRVLRPGGHLRVLVPDVVAAFDAWGSYNDVWAGFAAITEPWDAERKFAHYLTWGGQNRTCFLRTTLHDLLTRNGFTILPQYRLGAGARTFQEAAANHGWDWLRELDSRIEESIIIEAVA